jgi:hypothetical protein
MQPNGAWEVWLVDLWLLMHRTLEIHFLFEGATPKVSTITYSIRNGLGKKTYENNALSM